MKVIFHIITIGDFAVFPKSEYSPKSNYVCTFLLLNLIAMRAWAASSSIKRQMFKAPTWFNHWKAGDQ